MSWSKKIDARDGLENLKYGDGPRPYMTPEEQSRGEEIANAVSKLSHDNARYNAVMDMTPGKSRGGRKSKSNKKAHSRRRKISKKSQTKKRK